MERCSSPPNARFADLWVSRPGRFALGVERASGRFYLSIPVANGLVDYEERYAIEPETFALYRDVFAEAEAFARRCRDRKEDARLIDPPGRHRGTAT